MSRGRSVQARTSCRALSKVEQPLLSKTSLSSLRIAAKSWSFLSARYWQRDCSLRLACRTWAGRSSTGSRATGASFKKGRTAMTRWVGILVAILASIGPSALPTRALATVITLDYASIATAVDDGPEDGAFDFFTTANLGSVV